METFKNVGWEVRGNTDAGLVTGGFNSAANIDPVTKERTFSVAAYLQPIHHRPNLKVFVESIAEQVVYETSEAGGRPQASASGSEARSAVRDTHHRAV